MTSLQYLLYFILAVYGAIGAAGFVVLHIYEDINLFILAFALAVLYTFYEIQKTEKPK